MWIMRAVLQRVASASVTGIFNSVHPSMSTVIYGRPVYSRRSGCLRDLQRLDGLGGYRNGSVPHTPFISQRQYSLTCIDSADDTVADLEVLTNKMYTRTPFITGHTTLTQFAIHSLQLRVFDDPATGSMWKQSVKDIDGDVLCVSQFTLFANTHKGNKPDFHRAMVTHSHRF